MTTQDDQELENDSEPSIDTVKVEETPKPKAAKKAKPAQAPSQTQRARAIAMAKIEAAKR
jgi:hypothetical protein